jgi:hypothetical protein
VKKAWADLSRIEEVRDAARGWKSAGAIDAPTLAAIETGYPDPRVRLHGFWRVLIFVLVSVIVNALIFFMMPGSGRFFGVSLVFGLILVGATEGLRGSRYSGTGADAATSFWALTYLLAAVAEPLFRGHGIDDQAAITLMILATTVLGALAAWRWGYWLYAACGAAGFYGLLGRVPAARLLWIVISLAAMWLLRRRVAPSLCPDHRRCLNAVFAVSAVALYGAVNLFSVDHRLVELLQEYGPEIARTDGPASGATRILSVLATALLPVAYVAWGVRERRRLLIGIGLLAAAASAATLRYYVHIAPLWEVLAVCGAILIGAAIAVQRALRSRSGGEWRGLTAEPLYEIERGGISPLAALAAHAAGGAAPAPERHDLETGGGEYGGGGATGRY